MFNLIAALFKEFVQENERMKKLRKKQWLLANRKTINWVERKYQFDVDHYGEVLPGKQERLKRAIQKRLHEAAMKKHAFKGYDYKIEGGVAVIKPRYRYKLTAQVVRVNSCRYETVWK